MKLKSLVLTNFQGLKSFTLDAGSNDCSVLGANGVGKTTIFSAFCYLLYGLDSTGHTFLPKPIDASGESKHGIESSVEAIFMFDDNSEITLSKSFKELWVKKRGSAKKVFTGHTTKYSIGGVPDILEKEYKKRLAEIAPESVFKLLTNVRYFSETLHWQDRRQILLDICGDISDTDIIASDKKLSRMPEILNGKTLEEQKKIITARKTKLNKELSELPVRIDEVSKGQPDITGLNLSTIEKELSELSKALTEKNEEAARIEAGGEIAEKIKKQREIEGKLLEIENQQRKQALGAETAQRKRISEIETVKDAETSALDKTLKAIKNREVANNAAGQSIIKLREEWNTVNDKTLDEGATICPTCGQEYPEDQAEGIREKFNVDKAEQLRTINNSGKLLAAEIIDRKNANKTDQSKVSIYEKNIEELTEQIDRINSSGPEPAEKTEKAEPKETKEQEALLLDLTELKLNINGLRANSHEAIEKINAEIDAITEKQKAENLKKQTLESYAKGERRIAELGAQQKTVAGEYESLEEMLFIMDEFEKAKASLLEGKVNSKFKLAKFSLFETQVNGALNPICETVHAGVGWHGGLNTSMKINLGIDIINTLCEHFGLTLPLLIDGCESVTETIPCNSQLIKLIVDADYPELTVKNS